MVRYAWVAAKLVLLAGSSSSARWCSGLAPTPCAAAAGGAEARLIAGSAYDVVALLLATGLSPFKPRRRRRSNATGGTPMSSL